MNNRLISLLWMLGPATALVFAPAGLGADVPPPNGPGSALAFDGVDDHLTAAPSALPTGNSPYTIEAWINTTTMNAGTIAAWGNFDFNNQVNAFRLTPTGLVNYWWGNDLFVTVNLVGAWHHVAATFDGTTRRILVDGVVLGSDAPVSHNAGSGNFQIGSANGGELFSGQMDEVRIWNVGRSPLQIRANRSRQLFGNESGLAAYYRFDENADLTALDSTGNANNTAALVNGPSWVESTVVPFAAPVRTLAATDVSGSSATLNGWVDGRTSFSAFEAYFEWGTSTSLGNELRSGFVVSPGAAPQNFSAALTGLVPGTVYFFRAVAVNGNGASYGATHTVPPDRTAPTIASCSSSSDFTKLSLTYSEPVERGSAEDPLNYGVTWGVGIPVTFVSVTLGVDQRTVTIRFSPPLPEDTDVTIKVKLVMDLAGNYIAPNSQVVCHTFKFSPGLVQFESYETGGGNAVSVLTSHSTFPDTPRERLFMPAFDTRTVYPDDSHDGFGARIMGVFVPPITGNYIFYLRSDDSSELWLDSSGLDPGNAVKIQEETGCCGAFADHPSLPQPLAAGQRYFIMALYKEGGGGDYCQVAAKLDTDPTAPNSLRPISASSLGWFADPRGAAVTVTKHPSDATVRLDPLQSNLALLTARFEAIGTASRPGVPSQEIFFQWQVNRGAGFVDLPGANGSSLSFVPTLGDNGNRYRSLLYIPGASATSSEAVLTVQQVNTPPIFGCGPNQTVLAGSGPQTVTDWATGIKPHSITPTLFGGDFNNSPPSGASFYGLASVDGGVLKLTTATGNAFGAFYSPVFPGLVEGYIIDFKAYIGGGTCCGDPLSGDPTSAADGFSVNMAADLPVPATYNNPGEEGAGTGLSVSFDTWDNGGGEAPAISLKWQGGTYFGWPVSPHLSQGLAVPRFIPVHLELRDNGTVELDYDGNNLINSLSLPTHAPSINLRLGFGARTAAANDNHWIDDLQIQAIPAGTFLESQQTLQFIVSNDNPGLFVVQPAIGANGTLTYTPAPGATGAANLTVVARDNGGTAHGGADTSVPCDFTITLLDPSLGMTCPPDQIVECGTEWDFTAPVVLDGADVSVRIVGTVTNYPGQCGNNSFEATRTWEAMDGRGNISRCSQSIAVQDTVPPVIVCPAGITQAGTEPGGTRVHFTVTAIDNCGTPVAVVCVPPPGFLFAPGERTVQCMATDLAGNTISCSFPVRVDPTALTSVYPIEFALLPALSRLTLSGQIAGVEIQEQGAGSLDTAYAGLIRAEVAVDTVRLTGFSLIDAETNGNWNPKPGCDDGTAPADYGMRDVLGLGRGALRNLLLDVNSPALVVEGGRFDAGSVTFSTLEGSSVRFDYAAPFANIASRPIVASAVNAPSSGQLFTTNQNLYLVIPVSIVLPIGSILSPNDTHVRLTGQLMAVRTNPPPPVPLDEFVIDPTQSRLTLSGELDTIFGVLPMAEQAAGSLVTAYTGAIQIATTADTIRFSNWSLVNAQENGNWDPLPGGVPGAGPADYGLAAANLLGTIHGAVRQLRLHVQSSTLPLQNGDFDARLLTLSPPPDGSTHFDLRLPATMGGLEGTFPIVGSAANQQMTGALRTDNLVDTLTIQVTADFYASLLRAGDTRSRLSGQLVARRTNHLSSCVVANLNDSGPGSLRQAILKANATPEWDLIQFNIPGGGVQTIAPLSPLPAISSPVTIDGYSQPGSSPNTLATGNNAVLRIDLSGQNAGANANGLTVYASNCVVRGLVINGFSQHGVFVNGHSNIFAGNFIGTDATGSIGRGNGQSGIFLFQSSYNLIGGTAPSERNVISANDTGVFITDQPGVSNRVEGNFVGVNAAGTAALGNIVYGVRVNYSSGNSIGGATPGAGNLIAGNRFGGIGVWYQSAATVIEGNRVGTDVTGTAAIPNGSGIGLTQNAGTRIGGTAPGARNLVSGNLGDGIAIFRSVSNSVLGNYVGTDVSGSAPLANENHGITIQDSAYNLIGGTDAGAGNVASGNGLAGVNLVRTGSDVSHNVIQGNFIGLDRLGATAVPNGIRFGYPGIDVIEASDNQIGGTAPAARNVISGNVGAGIRFGGTHATRNIVQGNFIGTDRTGLVGRGNGQAGIAIHDAPANIIGGGNVISGNHVGIQILGANGTGNTIEGNVVGLDAAALEAIPNQEGIVVVGSPANLIGGTSDSARNVISGNAVYGVLLQGGANANQIFGNYIGTRADGLTPVGNGLAGVAMDRAPGNFIGGGSAGQGNLISGNGVGANPIGGVYLFQPASQHNVIAGNRIGTDSTGLLPVPNAIGVFINGAANNLIGGSTTGAGNVIAFNTGLGVAVYGETATGNAIVQNSIFANAALGIDLSLEGPTPNDSGDADAGPNQLQNFPLLTLVSFSGGSVNLHGILNSRSGTPYRLDFYANAPCDSSGHGEGAVHLGTTSVTTDGNGNVSFNISLPAPSPGMRSFTTTATDPAGNTSEFSPCASPRFVVNSILPLVSTQRIFSLGGFVNSEDQRVTRISYRHNDGPEQTVCENCGANPEFRINLTLSGTCSNNPVTITAHGEFGSVATHSGSVRFEDQLLAIHCPDKVVAACGDVFGAVVNYVVTASGGGPLTTICTPPSGWVFPTGTTVVECAATNACGTVARCSFPVTVIDSTGLPAPILTGTTPTALPEGQATWITVRGTNLAVIDEVLVHGTPLRNAIFVSAQEIQGELPALPAGVYDVQIRRCDGVAAQLTGAVAVGLQPVIESIEPAQVYARGGFVTVRGKNLRGDTRIRIGFPATIEGANLLRNTAAAPDGLSIVGEAPLLPPGQLFGPRDVIVEDARGQSILRAALSYIPNPVETDQQVLGLRKLEDASLTPVEIAFRNGFPSGISMRVPVSGASAVERARHFVRTYQELLLQQDPDNDLLVGRVTLEDIGHVALSQQYRGVPVYASEVVISLVRGEVFAMTGALLPSQELENRNLNPVPALTQDQALEAALTQLGEALPPAGITPTFELVVFDLSLIHTVAADPHLTWHIQAPGIDRELFVDAHSGRIVFNRTLAHQHGADQDGFDLDLRDASGAAMVKDGQCVTLSSLAAIATENGIDAAFINDNEAVLASQHIGNTYSFFHRNFGWHSYDNRSSRIDLFVHDSVPNAEALGGCWMIRFSDGWMDYEVMVHEFTHMIITSTSRLQYSFQPGALNESYADVMAVAADRQAGDLNWTLGENRTSGAGALRDVEDPRRSATVQPIFAAQYDPGVQQPDGSFPDAGGVHRNSGIPNRAAFFMSEGVQIGTRHFPGMGLTKMQTLKFDALRNMAGNVGFAAAARYEVAVAETWAREQRNGFVAQDVCAARNAWFAVGVGTSDLDCDGVPDPLPDRDGDQIPDPFDNCPLAANPRQEDTDNDGYPEACDNCPGVANDQKDTDGDGSGDACDVDIDGDGCWNNVDQHPYSNTARTGTLTTRGCCGNRSGNADTLEENDSDGDGKPDCADTDDDNDGIADEFDPCPTINPWKSNRSCDVVVDCPCAPKTIWWETCINCGNVFARFRNLTTPDPAQDVLVDRISIVNQTLYLAPNAGNTLAQTADALRFRPVGFAAAGQAGPGVLRIELWSRPTATEPARLLSVVGEFDAAAIQPGQLVAGSLLALTPSADASLTMDAVWSPGAEPASATRDTDSDGMLDGWEIRYSLDPRNPADANSDADGDGVGNLAEFRAGTSPTDAQSLFRITQVRTSPQGLRIEFRAVPGRRYQVERVPALGEHLPWQPIGERVQAMGGNMILDLPLSGTAVGSFYRVSLVPE